METIYVDVSRESKEEEVEVEEEEVESEEVESEEEEMHPSVEKIKGLTEGQSYTRSVYDRMADKWGALDDLPEWMGDGLLTQMEESEEQSERDEGARKRRKIDGIRDELVEREARLLERLPTDRFVVAVASMAAHELRALCTKSERVKALCNRSGVWEYVFRRDFVDPRGPEYVGEMEDEVRALWPIARMPERASIERTVREIVRRATFFRKAYARAFLTAFFHSEPPPPEWPVLRTDLVRRLLRNGVVVHLRLERADDAETSNPTELGLRTGAEAYAPRRTLVPYPTALGKVTHVMELPAGGWKTLAGEAPEREELALAAYSRYEIVRLQLIVGLRYGLGGGVVGVGGTRQYVETVVEGTTFVRAVGYRLSALPRYDLGTARSIAQHPFRHFELQDGEGRPWVEAWVSSRLRADGFYAVTVTDMRLRIRLRPSRLLRYLGPVLHRAPAEREVSTRELEDYDRARRELDAELRALSLPAAPTELAVGADHALRVDSGGVAALLRAADSSPTCGHRMDVPTWRRWLEIDRASPSLPLCPECARSPPPRTESRS